MKYEYRVQTVPQAGNDTTIAQTLNQWGADGYEVEIIGSRLIGKRQVKEPADVDLAGVVEQLTETALAAMQDPAFPGQPYQPDQVTDELKNRVRATVHAIVKAYPDVT
jgi:hypothetical protein